MDIHMPRMCGWDAARIIRDMGSRGEAKRVGWIVALTAASTLSDREESLKLMDMFVSKPIPMAKLAEILNHICECLGIVQTFQVRRESCDPRRSKSPDAEIHNLAPTANYPTMICHTQRNHDVPFQWLGGIIFMMVLAFLMLIRAGMRAMWPVAA
jgi:DNA-binding NarL/FixJ family response regulator